MKYDRLPRQEKTIADCQISLTDEQVQTLERVNPEFRGREDQHPYEPFPHLEGATNKRTPVGRHGLYY